MINSAGKRFKEALKENSPLLIVGTPNAYSALQATKIGHKAIYISGSGVASVSYGLPDLGIVGLEDFCIDVRRITSRVDTPLLVDCDTGFLCYETAHSVAKSIDCIVDNRDLLGRVGKNAQDNIYISWDDSVKNAYNRYQVVIDKFNSTYHGKYKY